MTVLQSKKDKFFAVIVWWTEIQITRVTLNDAEEKKGGGRVMQVEFFGEGRKICLWGVWRQTDDAIGDMGEVS